MKKDHLLTGFIPGLIMPMLVASPIIFTRLDSAHPKITPRFFYAKKCFRHC